MYIYVYIYIYIYIYVYTGLRDICTVVMYMHSSQKLPIHLNLPPQPYVLGPQPFQAYEVPWLFLRMAYYSPLNPKP